MSKIIVVFKNTEIMPLSFDTDDYYWDYSGGHVTEKIFCIRKKIGDAVVLIVPWENLNHFYIAEE